MKSRLFTRRKVIIVIAVVMVFSVFLYVEHPFARSVKTALSFAGFIDSERVVVGVTDVRSVDHKRGDEDADIVLIEYSDFNCVMCAVMQENFNRIVREEGVLLVSRHLYLDKGSDGFEKAVAAECVAKHAGEDAYFQFVRYLYQNQYTSDALSEFEIEAIQLGVEARKFQSCVASDADVRGRVERDSREGQRLGARGTPYIVVVYKDRPVGISYANEYGKFLNRVESLVEQGQQ